MKLNDMKKLVLAGNFEQFRMFMSQPTAANDDTFVFADTPEKIYAQEADEIVTLGTFWDKPNAMKLYKLAETRIK